MNEYVNIFSLKKQFDGIMQALQSDEQFQKEFLNSMGCLVEVKDDLAEDLCFLVECVSGHPNKSDCFTASELQRAKEICLIFDDYSGQEYWEFWQFDQPKYAAVWKNIRRIAS